MPPVFVSEDDFLLQNYTYELPQEQIAQYPPEQRGTSRLLTKIGRASCRERV